MSRNRKKMPYADESIHFLSQLLTLYTMPAVYHYLDRPNRNITYACGRWSINPPRRRLASQCRMTGMGPGCVKTLEALVRT